jgi:glycosyltransferase involved in cell wall biosynthesis
VSRDFSGSFYGPPPESPVRPGSTPTFSILIAAYQAEPFVVSAIESALGQTLPAHEIIVCDDGSTDGTPRAIEPFRDRVVYLHKDNGGEASAKNAAARAATGEFVALLDADDTYLPERLEALGQLAAARPDLDILTTDALLEADGEIERRVYADASRFDVADQRRAILRGNFICGHCAIRRERWLAVGGFDESIRYTADWDCWIRLIIGGSRAGLVFEPLAVYRIWEGSLSSARVAYAQGHVQTLEKTATRDDLDPAERGVLDRSLARRQRAAELTAAEASLAAGDPAVRRRLLRIALGRGYGLGTRFKAAGAALAPAVARRCLERYETSRLARPGY